MTASSPDRHPVVLGADIGGTSTRVAVAGTDGSVLATARGGPGNPNVVGLEASARTVREVCAEALERAGDTACEQIVLGLAGVTKLRGRPEASTWTRSILEGLRLHSAPPVRLVSDFAVAFSSATDAVRGVAAITGTGAGAMLIDRGEDITRRDAWGWLLGDEGSGFWIGREAMRATLAATEAGHRHPLADAVRAELGVTTDDPDPLTSLLHLAYAGPPRDLADLAPLVAALPEDRIAADILARAAESVTARILDLTNGDHDLPIVLAGSVATGDGPLAEPVSTALRGAGRRQVRQAGDGMLGALWLALTTRPPMTEPLPRWSHVLGSLGAHGS
ncbi:N-acetylglucosamine kinase [Propionibacteriaceae bacterium Y1685]